jgi:PII-like signaling protein
MAEAFELKGTIKIEGAEEVAKAIQSTAEEVDKATTKMADSSEKMASEFDANTAQVNRDFDQLEKNITKSAANIDATLAKSFKNMTIAGAAITAAITGAGIAAAASADDINDWSVKLGISTGAVQELSYIAKQNSLDMSSMGMAIRTQNELMVAAASGTDTAVESLSKLGLSYSSLAGMNPEEQFFAIANAISGLNTAQEQSAAATDIWGARVGQNLLPMIAQGAEGIQGLRDRYQDLNAEMSPEKLASLQDMHDSWNDLTTVTKDFANTLGAIVAPAVKFVFGDILIPAFKAVKTVLDLIPKPLKDTTAGLTLAVGGFLLLAGGIGTVITKMPMLIGSITTGITFLGSFASGAIGGGRALIGMAATMLRTAASFAIYVAKLIPVIVAQAWAWATNWPLGTLSFIAGIAAAGAAIYGIVRAVQSVGGEGGTPEGAEAGIGAASGAATSATAAGGVAEIPTLDTGAFVPRRPGGTIVRLAAEVDEYVLRAGQLASGFINGQPAYAGVTITDNTFYIREEADVQKIAEELDTLINRKVRNV